MIDPFSLVISGASSWAIGRLLDSAVSCFCGGVHERNIQNNITNQIACPRCNGSLDQYTNATQHTVNRNGSIAAAHISGIRWEKWGGLFSGRFNPHFRVRSVNSKYEDLVVRFELSEFHAGHSTVTKQSLDQDMNGRTSMIFGGKFHQILSRQVALHLP